MLKKYKMGFDIWGLILFLVIMIPNFIWFAIPAPNDILRVESITEEIDTIASICQVFMVVALCMFLNKESGKISISSWIIGVVVCCLLYCVSWIFYYSGVTTTAVILGLTLSPCLAFLLLAIDRKNGIAVVPIWIFTICHLIYAMVNFIV